MLKEYYCDKDTAFALQELGYNPYMFYDDGTPAIHLWYAQKWLREEKKLFVEITIEAFDQTYLWEIYSTENSILIAFGDSSHNTYEEALSEGVRASIKILQDEQKENN